MGWTIYKILYINTLQGIENLYRSPQQDPCMVHSPSFTQISLKTNQMQVNNYPPVKYITYPYISHLRKFGKSSTQKCQLVGGYVSSQQGRFPYDPSETHLFYKATYRGPHNLTPFITWSFGGPTLEKPSKSSNVFRLSQTGALLGGGTALILR